MYCIKLYSQLIAAKAYNANVAISRVAARPLTVNVTPCGSSTGSHH